LRGKNFEKPPGFWGGLLRPISWRRDRYKSAERLWEKKSMKIQMNLEAVRRTLQITNKKREMGKPT